MCARASLPETADTPSHDRTTDPLRLQRIHNKTTGANRRLERRSEEEEEEEEENKKKKKEEKFPPGPWKMV